MQIVHAEQALLPEGWVRDVEVTIAEDGCVASVGPRSRAADCRVDLLLSAPANLHSHAFQRAMSGLTEMCGPEGRDSFWTWRRLMFRFLDRLTPEQVEAIAAQVFLEMAEAGYAAVAEFHYMHLGPGGVPYTDPAEMAARVLSAATDVGLGLTLLPVHYRFGGCDGRPLEGGQRRFGTDPEGFAALHAATAAHLAGAPVDTRLGVAPHSLRAVDATGLALCMDLAGVGPIHMHLAEQEAEVAEVQAHRGARPVDWLLDHAPVDDRWSLIHCTQMTGAETLRLARSGAVAGLCPITESNLGDGIFNGTTYLGAGGRAGVGSDSNVQIVLFDELRTLDYAQRLRDRARAPLARPGQSSGRVLFEMAAQGGAQAAGRDAGAIRPGALADLVGVETDNEWICGRQGDAVLDSLIFGGHGQACVREVWSAGRHIVTGGRHPRREAIVARFRATMDALGQAI